MKRLFSKITPYLGDRPGQTFRILLALTAAGFVARILCCFWGYPYMLHGDERIIIHAAAEMLSRHSWEADVYVWPAHFPIKLYAILFEIVSRLRYHEPAWTAYLNPGHEHVFYMLGRAVNCVWGTLMIPLGYLLMEKCRKNAGLIGAGVITFFPILIQHSAYATADIVLAFFVMAVTWVSILYMEKASLAKLTWICALTGFAITTKYTGAVCCIWIAVIVCRDCIRRRKYFDIVKYGIYSVIIVLAAAYLIGPNLFTNYQETIQHVITEARPDHLGADGLNAWQNFLFYFKHFAETMGVECVVFMVLGVVYILKKRTIALVSLANGLIFWIFTSILALHWERWGMPFYPFFLMAVVLGFFYALDIICGLKKAGWRKVCKAAAWALMLILLANCVLSGVWVVRYSLMKDSRAAGKLYCDIHGINRENTVYDGYSPLAMNESITIPTGVAEDGTLMMPLANMHPLFLMVSSGLYGRFFDEPDLYADMIQMYELIDEKNELIYESVLYEYHSSPLGGFNAIAKIYDLVHSRGKQSGPMIRIYSYQGS